MFFDDIKNNKLFFYLEKYKDEIVQSVIDEYIEEGTKKNVELKIKRNMYDKLIAEYMRDISQIKTVEELPDRWRKHFEKAEIQKIIEEEKL